MRNKSAYILFYSDPDLELIFKKYLLNTAFAHLQLYTFANVYMINLNIFAIFSIALISSRCQFIEIKSDLFNCIAEGRIWAHFPRRICAITHTPLHTRMRGCRWCWCLCGLRLGAHVCMSESLRFSLFTHTLCGHIYSIALWGAPIFTHSYVYLAQASRTHSSALRCATYPSSKRFHFTTSPSQSVNFEQIVCRIHFFCVWRWLPASGMYICWVENRLNIVHWYIYLLFYPIIALLCVVVMCDVCAKNRFLNLDTYCGAIYCTIYENSAYVRTAVRCSALLLLCKIHDVTAYDDNCVVVVVGIADQREVSQTKMAAPVLFSL